MYHASHTRPSHKIIVGVIRHVKASLAAETREKQRAGVYRSARQYTVVQIKIPPPQVCQARLVNSGAKRNKQ